MKWNKILILYLFVLVAFCMSCTRAVNNTATVTINIPQNMSAAHANFVYSAPMTMNITAQNNSINNAPQWNTSLNPSPLTAGANALTYGGENNQVNCYAIMIASSQPNMQSSQCTTTDGGNFYVGAFAGAIPAGGELSLNVPSGPQQQITVVGFHAENSACRSFAYPIDAGNLSQPFVIGNIVQDLPSGTVTVNVPVFLDSTKPVISSCDGPAFNLQPGPFFGGAPSSGYDYIVTSSWNIDSSPLPPNLQSVHTRVTGYDTITPPAQGNDTILTVNSNIGFSTNDEVMLIIMGSNGKMGPSGDNNYGGCGYRAWNGLYQFAHVTNSVTGKVSINRGTFLDNLWQDANGNTTLFETSASGDLSAANARMSATPTSDTSPTPTNPFCYIQMVRVPHFYNLTINDGMSLSVGSFVYGGGGGGVIAFRVENNLTLGIGATIDASGKGYPISASGDGSGVGGLGSGCNITSPTLTGGGCTLNSGGGGGYGSSSLAVTSSGGDGNGGANGGKPLYDDCGDGSCFGSLEHKIFFGGAGGVPSTLSTPPNGGGIIYIAARTINLSGDATISANGISGDSSQSGGGAGGSIYLQYHDLNTNSNAFNVEANGGNGFSGTLGGGGGAAGRIHIKYCNVANITNVSSDVTGGTTGATATNGLSGSVLTQAVNCP